MKNRGLELGHKILPQLVVDPSVKLLPARASGSVKPLLGRLINFARHSRVAVWALAALLIGVAGIQASGAYLSSNNPAVIKAQHPVKITPHAIAGLNITVPNDQLAGRLQAILNQPATLTVGSQVKPLTPDTIRGWLQITPDAKKAQTYISIRPAAINASLSEMAKKYARDPIHQITVNHGAPEVVIAGRNGAALTNLDTLKAQSQDVAKSVMDAKGLQFNTPLETVAFQSLTPAAFNKLIEVDVVTKQMYLYENGNLIRSYPISAGAPETPTPVGQFKIFSKPAKQDMRGPNADGTNYFQPNVRWINYFRAGGYAIHGNYWRPQSWFGVVNSSHGCVSLPENQAKQVYDWSPIGTTVIIHY